MGLYFAAVEPQPELSEKIRKEQNYFADKYHAQKASLNFPHLTIIPPFHYDEQNEAEVVGHFKKLVLTQKKFTVQLDGFGAFSNPKNPVIYIKPEYSDELVKVYSEVKAGMPYPFLDHFNPHVTVAYRDLDFENFEKAWKEFAAKTFSEKFQINSIKLYKHFDKIWNRISERILD